MIIIIKRKLKAKNNKYDLFDLINLIIIYYLVLL